MDFFELPLPRKNTARFFASKALYLPRKISSDGLGNYEPLSIAAFLASAEQTRGAIFDIGANFGIYSLMVAAGLRRHVLAFEPFSEPAKVLEGVATNENLPIDVYKVAMSDKVGSANLYISTKSDMSNSLNSEFRDHAEIESVLTTSVDQIAERIAPGQIKIDVETMEVAVLRGGLKTIARDRPNLLVEILDRDMRAQVEEILSPHGYVYIDLGTPEFADQFDMKGWDISGDRRNVLAVTDLDMTLFLKRTKEWVDYIRTL